MPGPVVVDTNILFSALLQDESSFAQIILSSDRPFFICESTIVELFKHKERITQLSQLTETDVTRILYLLLKHITVSRENLIAHSHRLRAMSLCSKIDPADTPHVALALQLDAQLWTGDKRLREGLGKRGFHSFFDPQQ